MSYRVPGIKEITPNIFLEVSPELAAERKLESGKHMYLPMISTNEAVNHLTSMHVDRATHTPAYKEISVKMTVLDDKGVSPLPRKNFRFGNRHPTDGVQVQKKWERADYWVPGTRLQDKLVQIKTTEPS